LGIAAPTPAELPVKDRASGRLTLPAVLAWLSSEGETVRRACASALASEVEERHAKAQADGYAAGQATAIREVEARHATALAHLAAVAASAQEASERALEVLAQDCAAIVAEAFSKIAGDALVSAAAAHGAVRAVLERARNARHLTVYVHPVDLSATEAERGSLQAALGIAALDVQPDAALSSGGCRVETEFGTIDAAFDVQLAALFETLRAMHQRPAEPA